MDLVVDPAPDGVKLPGTGYTSGSLQDNITISNDKGLIGGHLKYTTGMVTMYPDDRLKQEGNFIALWLHEIGDPYVNYDKIEAKIVDGAEEKELEVSDEGYICFRVNNRATTKLVVTVTIGDQTYDAEYKLTGLTVDSYGWNILKGTNLTGEDLYQWGEYVASDDIYSDDSNKKFSIVLGNEDNGVKSAYSMVNGEINSDTIENEWIKSQFTFTSTSGFSDIGACLIATTAIPLKPNTKYTYSYYEKGTRCSPMTVQVNRDDKQTGSWPFVKNYFEPVSYNDHEILEDKYTRHEISFTTDEDISEYVFRVGFYVAAESNSQDYTWSIAGLKLEEGDHATGWDDYYSGDNLLLDTDQPVISNVNDHVTNGNARSFLKFNPLDSELNTASIQFIPDSDLPEKDLKINNKMVFQFNQTGNAEGGTAYCGICYHTRYMDTITDETFKDGDIVTLSFYAKINEKLSNGKPINNYLEFVRSDTEQIISTFLYLTDSAVKITKCLNGWSRYVITSFVNKEVLNKSNLFPVIRFYIATSIPEGTRIQDYHMEYCGVKLEKGAHVTDYRPAPTDFNINYLLKSNPEKTTEAYNICNVYGISSIKNISYDIPVTLTVDGDVGEGKYGFGAYEAIYYGEPPRQLNYWYTPFCGANIINPPPATNAPGRPFIKNNIFGYVGTYVLTNPATHKPELFDDSSEFVGIAIYAPPESISSVSSTVHKVKLEVGRYPTKWVEGVGEPVLSSDEEDDDLEVT